MFLLRRLEICHVIALFSKRILTDHRLCIHPHSSVYTLVLLSLDRYLAVVYPVRSIGLRTVCNATVAIVVVWTVVGAACVPILFVFFVKVGRSAIG